MRLLSGCFSLILALFLAAAPAAAREGHQMLAPFSVQPAKGGEKAPEFVLPDMDGRKRSLAEFRGRVLVVHFWASWCVPCRQEFPALSSIAAELGPRGLSVVGVAADSRERVEAFLRGSPAAFPVLIDQYGSVMRKYGVGLIPVSVIVGRDGRLIGTALGPKDYSGPEAREFFERLLK